jgi:hypothetical protein
MRIPVKQQSTVGQDGPAPMARSPLRMRAKVLIPKDSPVTQIEIEVIAALLDDWDGIEPSAHEDHSK